MLYAAVVQVEPLAQERVRAVIAIADGLSGFTRFMETANRSISFDLSQFPRRKHRRRFWDRNGPIASAVERGSHLVLLRHLAVRRQLVDDAGQGGGQLLEQFLLVQSGALRDLADDLRTDRIAEIIGVDRLVLPGADPGVGDVAVAGVFELVEQAAQTAEQAAVAGGGGAGGGGRLRLGRARPVCSALLPLSIFPTSSAPSAIISGLVMLPPGTALSKSPIGESSVTTKPVPSSSNGASGRNFKLA